MVKPYQRVQLFSGGGSRFGYYLGSYAALCEMGLKPDLILATCGGSLAALLVDIAPDPLSLKSLIQSRELYQVICASQPRERLPLCQPKPTLSLSNFSYFTHALKRFYLSKQPSKLNKRHVDETYDDLLAELSKLAMFEIDNESTWLTALIRLKPTESKELATLPSMPVTPSEDANTDINKDTATDTTQNTAPHIAIIASRLLADIDSSAQTNPPKAKLQEVLFAPSLLAQHSTLMTALQCPTHQYAPHRIKADIHAVYHWDIQQAVRASMADMYYLTPTFIEDIGWCLGGVIDLTPIEMACQLGATVFAETKADYDKWLAVPAIKRVFAFDAKRRLQGIQQCYSNLSSDKTQIHWLPFADNGPALAGQYVSKRINWLAGRIEPVHPNYNEFVQQMQAQWYYGYDKTMQYIQQNNTP
ncbi:MAG: patatin-like phospholipase family protein [Psychrobacter sp.]|nr:patatin-like phospholipase family protein [Psychrobacter sp.]